MPRASLACLLPALLLPAAARATGICENTGTTYGTPTLYAETTEAFAIPATLSWCEERQDGGVIDEVRGTIAFTELRDVRGSVIGVLSEATGADATRLAADRGAFDHVPRAALAAELAVRGYAPIVAQSPVKAACEATASWKLAPDADVNGFPAVRMFAEVRAGKRRMHQRELGLAATQRRGKGAVIAHFSATKKHIALFTLLPTCSGPPPGYFGPDDGGVCYEIDTVATATLDGRKGALARCFPGR